MGIIYRKDLTVDLTPDQVDNNFMFASDDFHGRMWNVSPTLVAEGDFTPIDGEIMFFDPAIIDTIDKTKTIRVFGDIVEAVGSGSDLGFSIGLSYSFVYSTITSEWGINCSNNPNSYALDGNFVDKLNFICNNTLTFTANLKLYVL